MMDRREAAHQSEAVSAGPSGGDELSGEEALIAAAAQLLRSEKPEIPDDFVACLFSQAVPEDLMQFDPRQLAALAANAWTLLAVRDPGAPRIRFESPTLMLGPGHPRSNSILEIVNDDMPFLLDSVLGELAERSIGIRFVVHPIFSIERDAAGRLVAFKGLAPVPGALRESFIHIQTDRIEEDGRRAEIAAALEGALADVRVCVQDWRPMMGRVAEVIADLKASPPPLPAAETAEAVAFLEWLIGDNFIFLGIRDYRFTAGGELLEPVFESGLGLLRSRDVKVVRIWNQPVVVVPQARDLLAAPTLMIVTKSSVRSRVHRRAHMDYVGVKRFGPDGRLAGEFRIVGLFTSTAYFRSTRSIPYLRRKVDAVLTRAGFA
ncbi:MAG TPA: NAD-glutamate dehydrogenase, partial [Xanthobacteraceae bacterium]